MEPEDRELRSALQRLFPPVHEVPATGTVAKGGESLRLRRRLEKAGVAVLIVALVAGAVAGVSWLTRDLPTRTTNPAPLVTQPAPGTPETYEPLAALPTFSLQDMREIDVSGPGAAFVVLTPEANAVSVDDILAAYAEVTLSPPADDGYTFPEKEPDVTMAFVPNAGEPLYIGMYAVMSSVSLDVWTRGADGVVRRAWISGDELHRHFREFFALASQYSLTALPALTRDDIYLVGVSRPGWDRKLQPGQDAAEIDAVLAAYDEAIMLPPPETYYPPKDPPAVEITLTFSNQPAVVIRLYQEASSEVMEVLTGGDAASGTASRARVGGDTLLALLHHYVELVDEQPGGAQGDAGGSTTTTSAVELPAAPPATELEHVAVLMKEVGIQNPEVTSRVIVGPAVRCYDLAWTVADQEACVATPDRVQRALAMAKSRGELSLDYYQIRVTVDGVTALSENAQISTYYDAALWGADPTSMLEETRSALLPQVETLAADYRLTLVDATVDVDQATQVLSVRVTMARDGDTQNLTKFALQLWALANVLNRPQQGGPGRVGVGYLHVIDPGGATLVFEVNDFITGTTSSKAKIKYPDRG